MDNYNYSFLYVYAMQGQKCVHAILKTSRTKDATSEAAEVIKHFPKILFFFFFLLQSSGQPVGTAATNLIPPSLSGGASPGGGTAYVLDPASPQSQPGVPHSVLRVIIENMLYPITIDVLHQVFLSFA